MPTNIRIKVGGIAVQGELHDSPCGRAVSSLLPLETSFSVWGDEFYFSVPLDFPLDDTATRQVAIGDIGYWPPGPAVAIFFGPTPLSTGKAPIPASEVNIVGRIAGDATVLRSAREERTIVLEEF